MGHQINKRLPNEANTDLEAQIEMEEIKEALRKGKRRKAPGSDGIVHEFYSTHWDIIKQELLEIVQNMYIEGNILAQQKHGVIVLLPKSNTPTTPDNYRALTLLNRDIKIVARIIAQHLPKWLPDIIHMGQHCGIHGTSMLDAVATVRDVIAYAEHMKKKLCLLTLDFKAAFDRLLHTYLYQALRAHGISEECITKIRTLYNDATASVQINGHESGSFPILSSVR
jgi:hypothetical protein